MEHMAVELVPWKGAEQMGGGGGGSGGIAGGKNSMDPGAECAWGLMTRLVWLGHRLHG